MDGNAGRLMSLDLAATRLIGIGKSVPEAGEAVGRVLAELDRLRRRAAGGGAGAGALAAALRAYEAQGTCANLGCDPFHMHKPDCAWPAVADARAGAGRPDEPDTRGCADWMADLIRDAMAEARRRMDPVGASPLPVFARILVQEEAARREAALRGEGEGDRDLVEEAADNLTARDFAGTHADDAEWLAGWLGRAVGKPAEGDGCERCGGWLVPPWEGTCGPCRRGPA